MCSECFNDSFIVTVLSFALLCFFLSLRMTYGSQSWRHHGFISPACRRRRCVGLR